MAEFTIPGGPDTGKTVAEAQTKSLEYWGEHAREEALRQACAAELERRAEADPASKPKEPAPKEAAAKGSKNQKPAPQTQIVKRPALELAGSFRDLAQLNQRMVQAQQEAHLVSAQTAIGVLPEGCSVAISVVFVDVEHETYGIPFPNADARGLSKAVLMRICGAAGIKWDPKLTCRLDDGSHPHYAQNQAVGRVRDLDGSVRVLKATKTVDLRDGSAQLEALTAKADGKDRDPKKQIREARANVAENAETKAMLRAIRTLGIRTSYQKSELAKPFVIVKLQFTGQTDDPVLKPIFAKQIAESFNDSSDALFGASQHPGNLLPSAPAQPPPRLPPPPVGSTPADDEALETEGEDVGARQQAGGPY